MIKILGVKKSPLHSLYILEKNQKFFSSFRKFLADLWQVNEDSVPEIYRFGRPSDEQGEPDTSGEEKIEACVDRHYCFERPQCTIDIVFGKERIFLIATSREEVQDMISEKLGKFCSL